MGNPVSYYSAVGLGNSGYPTHGLGHGRIGNESTLPTRIAHGQSPGTLWAKPLRRSVRPPSRLD